MEGKDHGSVAATARAMAEIKAGIHRKLLERLNLANLEPWAGRRPLPPSGR
jgi:hypothetical protein